MQSYTTYPLPGTSMTSHAWLFLGFPIDKTCGEYLVYILVPPKPAVLILEGDVKTLQSADWSERDNLTFFK